MDFAPAARSAALAGCGTGTNGEAIGGPERERLRKQARQWLREELVACRSALELDPKEQRDRVKSGLDRCHEAPDLSGLREPSELDKLQPDEREPWLALWEEFGDVAKQLDAIE